jgi:hypothetical protein
VTTTVPDSQKQAATTAYRILRLPTTGTSAPSSVQDAVNAIKDVGVITAATKTAAIREAAGKHGAGVYVAVTDKSWKPQKVTIEQTTVVKVGDA